MYFRVYFLVFVLLILNAFIQQRFIPLHLFSLLCLLNVHRYHVNNKDYIMVFLLWIYKLLLLFLIKKDALLWIVYDVICICISVYFLMRSLKFLFCK